jgi:uncharacterized membrane protein
VTRRFEGATVGHAIAAVMLGFGALAYPWLGQAAIERFGVGATASALLVATLAGVALRSVVERRALRSIGQSAGALVLLGLAATSGDRTWLQLFPALVNAYLAVIFALSVATGRSIVERGARVVEPYLPAFTLGYCRKVTLLWVAFFGANALGIGLLALGPPERWKAYTVFGYPALIAGLSLVEFFVRKIWFRNYHRGPVDRLLATFFPAEASPRGRRSQRFIAALHAAGYGPDGPRRGQPLDGELLREALRRS